MAKHERNGPCHCGSKLKYKKCCGNPAASKHSDTSKIDKHWPDIQKMITAQKAEETIRKQQQGLGKPIISADFQDYKFVAVGNRLHYSKNWKTFPDFLFSFLRDVLGREWFLSEKSKLFEERHPVLQWHHIISEKSKADKNNNENPSEISSTEMYGAISCYLGLAYSLYLLNHNVELQEIYINRLKDINNFQGTYYELIVANCLIRAGFKLELEDETDDSIKHCEFSAVSITTNKKYWVEAKSRSVTGVLGKTKLNGTSSTDPTSNLSMHVKKALLKPANGERLIFVDVNAPNALTNPPNWCERAGVKLDRKEKDLKAGEAAYVFVTNLNFHFNLDSTICERSILAYGLGIPDFAKIGYTTLRKAYESKKKHIDAFNIMESFKEYSKMPNTFDGSLPSEKFGNNPPRIKIGETYLFGGIGRESIVAKVHTATVMEREKTLIVGTDKGMFVRDMTEDQLIDYRNHKEVYFGTFHHQGGQANTPFELFEFFVDAYIKSSKEQMLKLLDGASDIEALKDLSKDELVLIYCERIVTAEMGRGIFNQAPKPRKG